MCEQIGAYPLGHRRRFGEDMEIFVLTYDDRCQSLLPSLAPITLGWSRMKQLIPYSTKYGATSAVLFDGRRQPRNG